ncbi:tRNA (N6-threonylcarbamoyladenosine(37)-N6)-methyltransferase TrmO [Moraxella oculi]|uniref:tRNA (N6-threonylcarbamoyladenosine(37)-N6)-methyltransferase TrmO n=1 Tax=Moraxella oculi TaxID=2940516 RepID=A0ABW8U4R1_9GAMM
MNTHTLPIIGRHHSPLSQKFGIPRQPNLVAVKSHICFYPPFNNPDAFVGIERYSHLWVLWQFHQNKSQNNFRPQVRPPRLGGNDKMGVFATRSMYRPSQLGMSVVVLDGVEVRHHEVILHIMGADMMDGTPIIDIKPYLAFVDGVVNAKGFDRPIMRQSIFTPSAKRAFDGLCQTQHLTARDEQIIGDLIAQDPRPAYRQHEIGIINTMRYKSTDVDFMMNEHGVLSIECLRLIEASNERVILKV